MPEGHESPVACRHPVGREKRRPSRRVVRQFPERPSFDDAEGIHGQKRDDATVAGCEALDNVLREVEPLASACGIRSQRFAAEPSHASRYSSRTGLKTSITVAPSGPQYA